MKKTLEKKIKSISEAYSNRAETLSVIPKIHLKGSWDKENACKEIEPEERECDGEIVDVLVGYNFDGREIFCYHAKSVNVHYYYEEKLK